MTDGTDPPEPAESPFWAYSVALYDLGEVRAACLSLQDRRGLDVNLLLFCCWRASRGDPALSPGEIAAAARATEAWQSEVVGTLRGLRRRLKGGLPPAPGAHVAALRDRLIALELDSERVEQRILLDLSPPAPDLPRPEPERPAAAAANIAAYLRLMQIEMDAADADDIVTLLASAFPKAARSAVTRLVGGGP